MCYSATDSLVAYILGTASSAYLITSKNNNLVVIGYFFLFVTQMQLFDYIFWTFNNCSSLMNTVVTKIAIIVNHLQPLILLFLQYVVGLHISPLSFILASAYLVISVFYTKNALENVHCTLTKNNIIFWEWNTLPNNYVMYGLFLASLVTSSFNFSESWIKWFTIFTSVTSFFIAQKTPTLNQSTGRIWCYYAAIIPLIYAVLSLT